MKALAGVKPPSEGTITVNGEPLESRLTDIGYLPQDEVVHGRLTVYEALDYAARLRLPSDTSAPEIEDTVDRVIDGSARVARQHPHRAAVRRPAQARGPGRRAARAGRASCSWTSRPPGSIPGSRRG